VTEDARTERVFRYPRPSWRVGLLCAVYVLGVFSAFCLPSMLRADAAFHGHMTAFFAVLVLLVMGALQSPVWRHRKTVLTDAGIRVGRRFAAWEDLKKIDVRGWPPFCVGVQPRRASLSWRDRFLWGGALGLPACEMVYRELIPAILEKRPDLELSKRVRRHLEDPSRCRPPTWPLIALALLDVVVLSWLVFAGPLHLMVLFAAGMGIFCLNLWVPAMLPWTGRDARDFFVRATFLCVLIAGVATSFTLFIPFEHYELQSLRVVALVLSSAALVVLLFMRSLEAPACRVALVVVLLVLPPTTYLSFRTQSWHSEDVTDRLADEDIFFTIWGRSGRYLSAWNAEVHDRVLDVTTGKSRPVPSQAEAVVVHLDGRLLVRRAGPAEDGRLLVYDFASGEEVDMHARGELRFIRGRPLSPDGRRLAWLEPGVDDNTLQLRVWNVETHEAEGPLTPLAGAGLTWRPREVFWRDDATIVVAGSATSKDDPCGDPGSFCMLRVRMGERPEVSALVVSSGRSRNWFAAPDGRYVLGLSKRQDGPRDWFDLYILEVASDRLTPLATPGSTPVFSSSGDAFFRATRIDGQMMLTRVEIASARETPLLKVPHGLDLAAVSGSGEFALFITEGLLMGGMAVVCHIPTGKQHRMYFSGLRSPTKPLPSMMWSGTAVFSPDDRRFFIPVIGAGGTRVLLYEIPPDWW